MTPKQFLLRMHEKAPWESRNVYNRDRDRDNLLFIYLTINDNIMHEILNLKARLNLT
jgi:hypothetical protein